MSQPPTGYALQGRYPWQQNATGLVVAGHSTDPSTGAATRGPELRGRVHQRLRRPRRGPGPDVGRPSSNTDPTIDATAPTLGEATLQSKLTGTQLLAHPAQTPDWFVQVTGTMPRNDLVEATALLQPPSTS